MYIGIIIIFNNNEHQIEKQFIIEQVNLCDNIEVCLVDNFSKDNTLEVLKEIKDACPLKVSVVEIKKYSSEQAAKKAGARFMFNQFNLKHIGFINVSALHNKNQHLNPLIETMCKNRDFIIDYNQKTIRQREVKQTLFKNIFSVVEYLKNIKSSPNYNNLNPSV